MPGWIQLSHQCSTCCSIPKCSNFEHRTVQGHANSKLHRRFLQVSSKLPIQSKEKFGIKTRELTDAIPVMDLTTNLYDEWTTLIRQLTVYVSTIVSKGNGADFQLGLQQQSILNPGYVGDLTGIGQSWKNTELQFEEATDFVLWADLTEALSPDWVDLVAVSADEPKGIDRLGVLLAFVPQSCDRVCRPFFDL